MEKRLIIAVTLSILVIVTYQYFFPAPKHPAPAARTSGQVEITKEIEQKPYAPPLPAVDEKEFVATTDKYIITFSDIGGAIKRLELRNYKKLNSDEPLPLVETTDPGEYIFSTKDTLNLLPLESRAYELSKKGGEVNYTLNLKDFQILKKYILRNSNNSIELQFFIKNISSAPKQFAYKIIGGAGMVEPHAQDKRLVEVISKVDGKIVNYKRPKNNIIVHPGIVSWVALKTKYFSAILKPFGETMGGFYSMPREDDPPIVSPNGFRMAEKYFGETMGGFYSMPREDDLIAGIEMRTVTIPAGSFVEQKFILYAGPSKITELKKIGYEFEESVNYGFFGGIAKILLASMALLNNIVHSWGLSIIILSVLLNVILFPLTLKSFNSMQKMHELHPQMEKLKAQHKDNPQKLNKEVMELYKKYNINPLSGCLPLLLQMPIFIALYQALTKSIDLRRANFLWIKDLSMPDAVALPFTAPIIGNNINILPIAMVILMVLQQKVSAKVMGGAVTEAQRQQQRMMLVMMPIMFGFIFYNMPSGMVLYWVVSTILTIVEQYAILKNT